MTRLGSLEQIDMLFTEAQPPEAFLALLAQHDVKLEVTN
jgi:DeoR family glycerol-3-phosphate regulon repressor